MTELQMIIWDNDDYETPIEDYPGYRGLTYDGTFLAETALQPLTTIDLTKYSELVDEHGGERRLNVALPSGEVSILFRAYDSIAEILDQLRTVKVYLDNGPPDAGPASGDSCFFFIADGVTETELEASIAALTAILKSDLASLEELARQQSGRDQ
jgi:hypothetical protein